MQYFFRELCIQEVPMLKWRVAAKRLAETHLKKTLKDTDIRRMACCWPLTVLCAPLVRPHSFCLKVALSSYMILYSYHCNIQASEITHYMIALSDNVAPLKSISMHLRIATYDLIPEVYYYYSIIVYIGVTTLILFLYVCS